MKFVLSAKNSSSKWHNRKIMKKSNMNANLTPMSHTSAIAQSSNYSFLCHSTWSNNTIVSHNGFMMCLIEHHVGIGSKGELSETWQNVRMNPLDKYFFAQCKICIRTKQNAKQARCISQNLIIMSGIRQKTKKPIIQLKKLQIQTGVW